ncbi:MAG: hypothetical protein HY201_05515 [Nitrospirae bacterium]|nr:hypothetical protein [Candidatus Troglogloeales bacterium]
MENLQILPIDKVAACLEEKLASLSQARVVFIGFSLPEEFGEGSELQFGDLKQLFAIGLGAHSVEMGKSFVLKTIEELFSGEFGSFVPERTRFCVTEEGNGLFTVSAIMP